MPRARGITSSAAMDPRSGGLTGRRSPGRGRPRGSDIGLHQPSAATWSNNPEREPGGRLKPLQTHQVVEGHHDDAVVAYRGSPSYSGRPDIPNA